MNPQHGRRQLITSGALLVPLIFCLPGNGQGLSEMGSVYGLPKPVPGANTTNAIRNLYQPGALPGVTASPSATTKDGQPLPPGETNRRIVATVGKEANRLFDAAAQKEKAGKLAESEKLYRQSMALRERIWGTRDPAVLVIIKKVGDLDTRQGKHAEAEAMYRRVLSVEGKRYGPGSYELVEILGKVAGSLEEQKKLVEAADFYNQIYGLKDRKLGSDHPDALAARLKAAKMYLLCNENKDVCMLMKQGIAAAEKSPDKASLPITEMMMTYAQALRALKKNAEADAIEAKLHEVAPASVAPAASAPAVEPAKTGSEAADPSKVTTAPKEQVDEKK